MNKRRNKVKFFGSILCFAIITIKLFSAEAYLLNPNIYEQESATVVIHVKGKEVKLPKIQEIAGLPVVDKGGQRSVQTINGDSINEFHYELTFYPEHTMTIPSFEVVVDGQKESTKPFELVVKEKKDKNFNVEATISKQEALQNEIIKLQVRFKCKETLKVQDIKFTQPDFAGFWVQSMEHIPTYREGEFIVHGMNYYIYPRHSGHLTIAPFKVEATQEIIDTSTSHSNQVNYTKTHRRNFVSNALSLEVKPLQGKTNLVGDFTLRLSVDKKELEGNEMLYATLKITGEGNFADIEPFVMALSEAVVSTNEPKMRLYTQNEKRQWEFVQRFSIGNAKQDFTIPSFILTFYDPMSNILKTAQSEPMSIHVNNPFIEESFRGGKEEKQSYAQPNDKTKKHQKGFHLDSISMIIGFLLGVVCVALMQRFFNKNKLPKLPHFTSHRELLQKLLAYKGENDHIDTLITKLEGNFYCHKNHLISKKEIQIVLKYIAQKEHFNI